MALPPKQIVAFDAIATTGNGNTVMVTVVELWGHKAEETVYVKTYGLPDNVKVATLIVPWKPLEVDNGPVQTPVLSGVPPNKLNKSKGAVVVNSFTQIERNPGVPGLFRDTKLTNTSNRVWLSQGGSTVVA